MHVLGSHIVHLLLGLGNTAQELFMLKMTEQSIDQELIRNSKKATEVYNNKQN